MADALMEFPSFPAIGVDTERLNRFSSAFPDPYLDYASTQMPRSLYDVFRWAEYVWLTYDTYRMAAQRVVRYFLTSVELTDASDDEKQKYEEFLNGQLKIMDVLAQCGDDYMAYGNSIVSLRVPFRRYLRCPKCRIEQPIDRINYDWTDWKFHGRCPSPKCTYSGEFQRIDRRSVEQDKLRIKRWSPHEIKLLYHPVSDETIYYWDIPPWFRGEITKGTKFYLEDTPWEIIEAIRDKNLFRFHPGVLHHMAEHTLVGVRCFGWGIPRIMGSFKQAWYLQVLKRYNEAIALDYIVPFRVLTPAPGTSREADPILHMNLPRFQSQVLAMFRQHRRDPASIHALPFPVQMQMLGADGKSLAPIELIDKGTDELLNGQGFPAELYRGTLQVQAMPTALRLFERTWVHMVTSMNELLLWLCDKVSDLMNWENMKARLQPVTYADDLERKQIQLQLAAGQQISRQTAWAPFNINFREEIKRLFEEEQYAQDQMAKFQEAQAQKQQLQGVMTQGAMGSVPGMMPGAMMPGGAPPGAMPPGGAPPGAMPPGGAPVGGIPAGAAPMSAGQVTPEDLMMQAEQIAQQMLSMPYEMRRSELLKIKKSNETLHALVVSKMEQIRQQARTQGGYQMLQQTLGTGM